MVENRTRENEPLQVEDYCASELERQKICVQREMNFSMPKGSNPRKSYLRICLWNPRSLNGKITSLLGMMDDVDVLMVQEAWIHTHEAAFITEAARREGWVAFFRRTVPPRGTQVATLVRSGFAAFVSTTAAGGSERRNLAAVFSTVRT